MNAYGRVAYRALRRFEEPLARRRSGEELQRRLFRAHRAERASAFLARVHLTAALTGAGALALALLAAIALRPPVPVAVGLFATLPLLAGGAVILGAPAILQNAAREKAKGIDENLPAGLNYLLALANAGLPPVEMWRSLARAKVFGPLAFEAERIHRDLALFSRDVLLAMRHAQERTPSERFREFLQGAISAFQSGVELESYLKAKSAQYQHDAIEEQKRGIDTVGVIAEAFLVVVVAAPLFLIILLAVMAVNMGGRVVSYGLALGLIFIPISQLAIGVIIRSSTPREGGTKRRLRWPKLDAITLGATACVLVGLAVASVGALTLTGRSFGAWAATPSRGIDALLLGYLVATGPLAVLQWLRQRRLDRIDARLPDFLTDLASLHKAGLTLQDSLLTAARGSYGPLDKELRIAADQVGWNVPIVTAIEKLMRRVGTPLAERTLTVVLEAERSGGNVPEVLEIAAENARSTIAMREERRREMGLYTIITYVASLVFVGVALAMQGIFVPKMIEAFRGVQGSSLRFAALPARDAFRLLFYTSAAVQAVGNGFVGGVMRDARLASGLKHAWLMGALTFAGFLLA